MADQRALLTETERAILAGEKDVKDNYRYSVESRVRSRIRDRLGADVDVLREHHPDMFDALQAVVCADGSGESGDEPVREPAAEPEPRSDADPEPDVDRGLLRAELAGSGELLERRVDAIVSMFDVLREQGDAEKSELLDAVDVDATGYADRESVWANMVKGRDTLRALPGVKTPYTGRSEWRYER